MLRENYYRLQKREIFNRPLPRAAQNRTFLFHRGLRWATSSENWTWPQGVHGENRVRPFVGLTQIGAWAIWGSHFLDTFFFWGGGWLYILYAKRRFKRGGAYKSGGEKNSQIGRHGSRKEGGRPPREGYAPGTCKGLSLLLP